MPTLDREGLRELGKLHKREGRICELRELRTALEGEARPEGVALVHGIIRRRLIELGDRQELRLSAMEEGDAEA